jgi:hypothetical protein
MPARPLPYDLAVKSLVPTFYIRMGGLSAGSQLADEMGVSGHNFLPQAGGPFFLTGQPGLVPTSDGKCSKFDGVNAWAGGPADAAVNSTTAITLCAWVISQDFSAGANGKIISKHTGAADIMACLGVGPNGVPEFAWNAGGFGSYDHSSPFPVGATFVAISVGAGRAKCWVNSSKVNDVAAVGALPANNGFSWAIGAVVGSGPNAGLNKWKGYIQEVAVFCGQALTDAQITYLYLTGSKVFRQKRPPDEETIASQLNALAEGVEHHA